MPPKMISISSVSLPQKVSTAAPSAVTIPTLYLFLTGAMNLMYDITLTVKNTLPRLYHRRNENHSRFVTTATRLKKGSEWNPLADPCAFIIGCPPLGFLLTHRLVLV
jgi:hypothetical protein